MAVIKNGEAGEQQRGLIRAAGQTSGRRLNLGTSLQEPRGKVIEPTSQVLRFNEFRPQRVVDIDPVRRTPQHLGEQARHGGLPEPLTF